MADVEQEIRKIRNIDKIVENNSVSKNKNVTSMNWLAVQEEYLLKNKQSEFPKNTDINVSNNIQNSKKPIIKPNNNNYVSVNTIESVQENEYFIEKRFQNRDSLLTDLLEISHFRVIYHIFIAILILLVLNTSIIDFFEKGGLYYVYHIKWIFWTFGKFNDVILIWSCMKLYTISIYPFLLCWFTVKRRKLISTEIFLFIYVISQILFTIVSAYYILVKEFPPCSSLIAILENIRMILKIHSFITVKLTEENSNDKFQMSRFSNYLYFLFAPTLIYRDFYPRTSKIRIRFVISNFIQVVFCIVFLYYIFTNFFVNYYQNFNSNIGLKKLVLSIFNSMLPGGLILFTSFFLLLHSWLNGFAEILRFGDRMFYHEWWVSTSFGNFYRNWNIVVHDWLFVYIYRDVSVLCQIENRTKRKAIVFLFSAVIHEYVVFVMLKFFYPVLFVMFICVGFGMMFINGRSRIWNVLFWVAMFSGMGILFSLYSIEWYARKNCPLNFNSFMDFFIPRSWFCHV